MSFLLGYKAISIELGVKNLRVLKSLFEKRYLVKSLIIIIIKNVSILLSKVINMIKIVSIKPIVGKEFI